MLTQINTVSSVTIAGRLSRHIQRPASHPAHARSSSSNATRTLPNTEFAEKSRTLALEMAYRPGGCSRQDCTSSTSRLPRRDTRPGTGAPKPSCSPKSTSTKPTATSRSCSAEYRNYQQGILPAGPGARNLTEFFASIDATLDTTPADGPKVQRNDRDILNLLSKRADVLHLGLIERGQMCVRAESRWHHGDMQDLPFDAQERLAMCYLFDELGADAPTLLDRWTARDLAAHIVLRERDPIAGPCIILPGPFERFAEQRRATLAERREFGWLVARIRSGPPPGLFRIGWVRSFPNLNEFFVHHEDVRRANGLGPRDTLTPALEAALWRNVCRGSRYLSRRLRGAGLEIVWAGTDKRVTVRKAEPIARLSGPPGELLLYLFGRQPAAQVEVLGPSQAVAMVHDTHFGM
jgi:uncharacterized protein (TIGR03085 family)